MKKSAEIEAARANWLRDEFAMAALQGILARPGGPQVANLTDTHAVVASAAFAYADAMLKERAK